MNIFLDDQDYTLFLNRLKENLFPNPLEDALQGDWSQKTHTPYVRKLLPKGSFSLITYCLMPNHLHLLIKQNSDVSISKLMSKVSTSYSKYFNKKYDRVGSVFQDQFKYSLVESNEYLLWLSAYIHLNPRVANLISDISSWKWGGYSEYFNESNNRRFNLCDNKIILDQFSKPQDYRKFIETSLEPILSKKEINFDISDAEFISP